MSYDNQVTAMILVIGIMVAGFVGLMVGRSQGNPLSGMGENEFRKYQQMSAERDAIDSLRRFEAREEMYRAAREEEQITDEDKQQLIAIIKGE
jgi:hypothetical protein